MSSRICPVCFRVCDGCDDESCVSGGPCPECRRESRPTLIERLATSEALVGALRKALESLRTHGTVCIDSDCTCVPREPGGPTHGDCPHCTSAREMFVLAGQALRDSDTPEPDWMAWGRKACEAIRDLRGCEGDCPGCSLHRDPDEEPHTNDCKVVALLDAAPDYLKEKP